MTALIRASRGSGARIVKGDDAQWLKRSFSPTCTGWGHQRGGWPQMNPRTLGLVRKGYIIKGPALNAYPHIGLVRIGYTGEGPALIAFLRKEHRHATKRRVLPLSGLQQGQCAQQCSRAKFLIEV